MCWKTGCICVARRTDGPRTVIRKEPGWEAAQDTPHRPACVVRDVSRRTPSARRGCTSLSRIMSRLSCAERCAGAVGFPVLSKGEAVPRSVPRCSTRNYSSWRRSRSVEAVAAKDSAGIPLEVRQAQVDPIPGAGRGQGRQVRTRTTEETDEQTCSQTAASVPATAGGQVVTRGVAGLDGRPAILMGAPKPQRCFHSFPSGQRRVERAPSRFRCRSTGACTHVVRDRGARPLRGIRPDALFF